MTKTHGLGDNAYVDAYDLSGDIQAIPRIGGGFTPLNLTDITQSAFERKGGVRDGTIAFTSYFDKAAGAAHPALSTLPTTDRIVTYAHIPALGNPAASMVAKQINYDPSRDQAGNLTIAVEAMANAYGLEWGLQHTAGKITHASADEETSVDGLAATDYGLQAYLHVFSVGSGTPTFVIQESSDNGSSDAFETITGGSFTITAAGSERIATAVDQTIERYLRVATTGTFTDAVFAVMVKRNTKTPTF